MAFNQTPSVKFENSPAESLLSSPSEMYPSLFGSEPVSSTMNPLEIMTPQSYDEDVDMSALTDLAGGEKNELTSSPSGEKKPVKKRKSWGQVLPEPKTNLPPRKRAKTEDEKEQRRVERVLRNRRAAQSSRERKRQEVEALEIRNAELEAQVRQLQQAQLLLVEELQKSRRNSGVVTRTPTSFDSLRSTPVTFSQELFSSQDSHSASLDSSSSSIEDLLTSVTTHTTVNPASLSPALTPVPEAEDEDEPATSATPLAAIAAPVNASPDATQHPAAMLCQDLQCRSAEAPRSWLKDSQHPLHPALALFLPLQLLLTSTSAMLSLCQRPLMQIAMSLKAGFSLPPTPWILNTIIWLVTTPLPSTSRHTTPHSTLTSPNSSTTSKTSPQTTSTRPSSTLRLKSLRKILTCSPTLARPLTDATMAVLRLASTEDHDVARVSDGDESRSEKATWLNGAALPSKEVLLTLLWAIRVESRRIEIRERVNAASKLGRQSVFKTPTPNQKQTFVMKVSRKRSMEREEQHQGFPSTVDLKRRRFG